MKILIRIKILLRITLILIYSKNRCEQGYPLLDNNTRIQPINRPQQQFVATANVNVNHGISNYSRDTGPDLYVVSCLNSR